ncbi:MAG: DUF1800 domain-containing protein [Gammaproteobacteria bacterium]|nr:DUF1800 domain-containing protein [Gammaproteobacteria bacterium]
MTTRPLARIVLVGGITALCSSSQAAAQSAETARAMHMLRRCEYGAAPSERAELMSTGTATQDQQIATYLVNQLSVTGVGTAEDPGLLSLLGLYGVPAIGASASPPAQPATWGNSELTDVSIARAMWSEYSLREKMTQFWQRHFSSNHSKLVGYFRARFENEYMYAPALAQSEASKYAAYFEWLQDDTFRVNAFGSFEDLLRASALQIPMGIYLDSVDSLAPHPNENLGRELLELHTLGLMGPYDPGTGFVELANYTDEDVERASEILSGWKLIDVGPVGSPSFQLQFQPTVCDTNNDPVDGHYTSCTGVHQVLFDDPSLNPWVGQFDTAPDLLNSTEVDQFLNHLAMSPITANFVIRKLYRLFISEDEPALNDPVIVSAVVTWLNSNGNIGLVLFDLLNSDRMRNGMRIRWTLPRTPLEIFGQYVDAYGATPYNSVSPSASLLPVVGIRLLMTGDMGQTLFHHPSPDGFSIESYELLTSTRMLGAAKFQMSHYALATTAFQAFVPQYSFNDFVMGQGLTPPVTNEVAYRDAIVDALYGGELAAADKQRVLGYIETSSDGTAIVPLSVDQAASSQIEYITRLLTSLSFAGAHSLNSIK